MAQIQVGSGRINSRQKALRARPAEISLIQTAANVKMKETHMAGTPIIY